MKVVYDFRKWCMLLCTLVVFVWLIHQPISYNPFQSLPKTLNQNPFKSQVKFWRNQIMTHQKNPRFHLSEIKSPLNNTLYHGQAILVIHGNYNSQNLSEYLYENIQKYAQRTAAIYSLDNLKSDSIPTIQQFNKYIVSINYAIHYLLKEINIKKITIIGMAEGSQFILRYISLASIEFFLYLDKIIFINCRYESIQFNHDFARNFYQDTLYKLSDPERINFLNEIRIISINTKKINKVSTQHQELIFRGRLLKNYVSISSTLMWNVYCNLQDNQVFKHKSFLDLFSLFLSLDSSQKLTIKQIEYFLKYKESPNVQISHKHKQQFLLRCPQSVLDISEQNHIFYFNQKRCSRIKFDKKQNNNSVLIITSAQIFTEKYIKIPPFFNNSRTSISNHSWVIYFFQDLSQLTQIYILNHKLQNTSLSVIKPQKVDQNQIINNIYSTNARIIYLPDIPLKICPQKFLLFPLSINECFNPQNSMIIQQVKSSCFISMDLNQKILEILDWNKNLHRNMIITTLFGLYSYSENIFSVFVLQIVLNLINFGGNSIEYIFIYTLLGIYISFILQKILKIFQKISQKMSYIKKQNEHYTLLIPFIFAFLKTINYTIIQLNQWYSIFLIILLASKYSNFLLAWILLYLNYDYFYSDQIQWTRLSYMVLCVFVLSYLNQYKKKMFYNINILFLLILNLFYDQEVCIVQTILELYVLVMGIAIVIQYMLSDKKKNNID